MKRLSDINYIEKVDSIKFVFPFTSTMSYFEDLRNKSISIGRIIEISKIMGNDSLNISYNYILDLLERLSNTSFEELTEEESQKFDFENLVKKIIKTSEDSIIMTEKEYNNYYF